MRKQTKIAALVSAAALLTIGASMSAFAMGWSMEDGQWVYLDRYGDRVSNEWKKSNGGYYYLGDDGYMVTSQIVEDEDDVYYVNESGLRVTNQWVSVDNDDDIDVVGNEVDTLWYYFGNTGKAYKSDGADALKVKTVAYSAGNAKFAFDEDGHMASGWQKIGDTDKEELYYFGDENEGWAYTGWQYLEPDEEAYFTEPDDEYEDQEWFYFQSSGKARKDTTKYINGAYYSFDENGVLIDEWGKSLSTPPEASAAQVFGDVNGKKNGWVYTSKPAPNDDDSAWYYLVTVNGTKTVAFNSGNEEKDYAAKVINGKTYLFDGTGAMKTGVVEIKAAEISTGTNKTKDNYYGVKAEALDTGIYYFSDADASQGKDGRMLTGRQSYTDDGETSYYYFAKADGKAVKNMIKDGVYYGSDCKRVDATDGNTNMVVEEHAAITNDDGKVVVDANVPVIVNSSGRIRKSGTVKIDGEYFVVKDYMVDKEASDKKNAE